MLTITSQTLYFMVSGILGFALATSAPSQTGKSGPTQNASGQQVERGTTSQKIPGFKLIRMSNGVYKGDTPFSQNTFETAPGEKVYVVMIHFLSAEGVKKEFTEKVDTATSVIERKTVKGKNDVMEERAVVAVKGKDGQVVTTILTTAGTVLREIQSYSAQAALEFEKQAQRADSNAEPLR
jgi:hypothetical protein